MNQNNGRAGMKFKVEIGKKKKKSFTSHNGGFAEIITILLRNMVFNDRIVKTI